MGVFGCDVCVCVCVCGCDMCVYVGVVGVCVYVGVMCVCACVCGCDVCVWMCNNVSMTIYARSILMFFMNTCVHYFCFLCLLFLLQ